jgi:hypothetical protein
MGAGGALGRRLAPLRLMAGSASAEFTPEGREPKAPVLSMKSLNLLGVVCSLLSSLHQFGLLFRKYARAIETPRPIWVRIAAGRPGANPGPRPGPRGSPALAYAGRSSAAILPLLDSQTEPRPSGSAFFWPSPRMACPKMAMSLKPHAKFGFELQHAAGLLHHGPDLEATAPEATAAGVAPSTARDLSL